MRHELNALSMIHPNDLNRTRVWTIWFIDDQIYFIAKHMEYLVKYQVGPFGNCSILDHLVYRWPNLLHSETYGIFGQISGWTIWYSQHLVVLVPTPKDPNEDLDHVDRVHIEHLVALHIWTNWIIITRRGWNFIFARWTIIYTSMRAVYVLGGW